MVNPSTHSIEREGYRSMRRVSETVPLGLVETGSHMIIPFSIPHHYLSLSLYNFLLSILPSLSFRFHSFFIYLSYSSLYRYDDPFSLFLFLFLSIFRCSFHHQQLFPWRRPPILNRPLSPIRRVSKRKLEVQSN